MVKDIQTCVMAKKTAFPTKAKQSKYLVKQDLVETSNVTDEKSTCPLRLMSFAQHNIRIKVLKAMRKKQWHHESNRTGTP